MSDEPRISFNVRPSIAVTQFVPDPAAIGPPTSTEDPWQRAVEDQLWSLRGLAIQAYAKLEFSLCMLVANLMRVEIDNAAIVFFKIVAYRTRRDILEKILKKRYQGTNQLFWNSLTKHLDDLDSKRNCMVHWQSVMHLNVDGSFKELQLAPPAGMWDVYDSTSASLNSQELHAFIEKCDFISRCCVTFISGLPGSAPMTPEMHQTWLSISSQPIPYPIPSGHPLSLILQTPETPPQASQE